jgi:very-short-patch-repair endonuclease
MDGGERRTRELDFLVVENGVPLVLELDGWPHNGRAAEDHLRDRGLKRSGIWLVERFPSSEALKDPEKIVRTVRGMMRSYRKSA